MVIGGSAMEGKPDGWEIISRHGNYGGLLRTLSAFITYVPPGVPDTITIKVRETATGNVHSITAIDDGETMAKLRDRIFD
jgi:hypothetical protein